jgi:phage terminase Nu1 subunit (DNA packaging protein)
MKKRKPMIVDTPFLAAVLNLSVRRIHQLVKIGLPKSGRGRFDFKACVQWYLKYLHGALENKGAPTGADRSLELFRSQKARSLLASVELKELVLAEKRANLVTREDADKFFAEFQYMVRARISSVAAPLAIELRGETSHVMAQAKIERALDAALALLATFDGPESAKNLLASDVSPSG